MLAPDSNASALAWCLLLPALLGFFLPGYFAFRSLESPAQWATSFIGSVLILFHGILILDLAGIPISFWSLGTFSAAAALLGLLIWRRQPHPMAQVTAGRGSIKGMIWWLIPVVLTTFSLVTLAVLDPLSGWDNTFRWNHLALLMRAQQSLAHYPPVTAVDFRSYAWCDGIPPAVPVANLWIYLVTGSTNSALISGRVLIELLLTFYLVYKLAHSFWGARGAGASLLLLTTSSLFLASIATAQETGMSGVAVLSLAFLGCTYLTTPRRSTLVWMSLAAALAALCRDYTLLFIGIVPLVLVLGKAPRAHWTIALGIVSVLTVPWYARNAWITGNPLFAHSVGGLFGTNGFHEEYSAYVRAQFSLVNRSYNYGPLLQIIAVGAGVLVFAAVPGFFRRDRRMIVVGTVAGFVALLWLLSVSSTAGGWVYSLRVLGPALPLLAVAGGCWGVRLSRPLRLTAGVCLLPLMLDANRRSWIFFTDSLAPVLPYSWTTWQSNKTILTATRRDAMWEQLATEAGHEAIVADHPNFVVIGRQHGGAMIPLFSPEAYPLTQAEQPCTPQSVARHLRRNGVRFVILREDDAFYTRALREESGLFQLYATAPTKRLQGIRVYDVTAIASASEKAHE